MPKMKKISVGGKASMRSGNGHDQRVTNAKGVMSMIGKKASDCGDSKDRKQTRY
jgi:hypothetical protein